MTTHTADRFLERTLLLVAVAHLVAMFAAALLLLPGIPGGTSADVAERAVYPANHPWLWRSGWFLWQAMAASQLLLSLALLRVNWVKTLPVSLSCLAAVVAMTIEGSSVFQWVTAGVGLAREAHATGEFGAYLQFETARNQLILQWAAMFSTMAAIGWSWTFAAAGVWNRWLTSLSISAWGLRLFTSAGSLILGSDRISDRINLAGNACGLFFMLIWLLFLTEQVLRRRRPVDRHGRHAPWKSPYQAPLGAMVDVVANARLPRAFGEWLPSLSFVSDITDVVYVNYLVEAERLRSLVPAGLELQQLGPENRYALFTFLTYRHGHFGPRFLGPFRRLLPSPIQSNWRIHVRDPLTGVTGISFVSTAITALPNALAARFLSEGVPMHLPRSAELNRRSDGSIVLRVDPGRGSAPDVDAVLSAVTQPDMPHPWNECFADFESFLAYCVPQDRAMSSQPWHRRITRQEITLEIPLASCIPLAGTVVSRAASEIVGTATPLCFYVPEVAFRYDGEQYDLRTE